jgi:formylglycine-generating enzyme required for sulfatase activity
MIVRLLVSLWVLFAAVLLTVPAWSQLRGNQVALLIGNANYLDSTGPLPATAKDSRALADELRRSNFEVDLKENLSRDDMQRAVDAFVGKIRAGTTALFFFNGFGIQVGRQTYLMPVNAQVWSDDDTRRDGLSLDGVVAAMQRRGARVKIVIVDAARRNPFERRFRPSAAGLAALDAPENTLAIYAAPPGSVISDGTGDTSTFMTELLKEMRTPNLTAEQVFNRTRVAVSRATNNQQIPWVASSLIDDFSFAAPARVATTPASPTTPAPTPSPTTPPAPARPPAAAAVTPAPSAPAPAPPPATPAAPARPSPSAAAPPSAPGPAPATPQAPAGPPATAAATPPAATPARPAAAINPGETFRDCPDCPELVVVPAGTFNMGSPAPFEGPVHKVTFARPFAVGRFEVTFDEWDRCVADKGCAFRPDDKGLGRGKRPVVNVSWLDAKEFMAWLSAKTGKKYRLPTEAEWEYVARGGTNSPFWWGQAIGQGQANCRECNSGNVLQTLPVGSFKSNPFGIFDTSGNAAEWVEDCWNDSYRGVPQDGTAAAGGQCGWRVLRGGAFDGQAKSVASAARFRYDHDVRYPANGFRVGRELP